MKLTLDTNAVIDLEQRNSSGGDLRRIVALHEAGTVHLQVPGIVASERLREGGFPPNFAAFVLRVQQLSRREIEVLRPIGHWSVTFWDEGLWADEAMIALEEQISSILFPVHPYDWPDCARKNGIDPAAEPDENSVPWRKWRNRLCDSAALWCHIYYSGDIFITRDNNFLGTKRQELEALGAKRILNPRDALAELQHQSPIRKLME